MKKKYAFDIGLGIFDIAMAAHSFVAPSGIEWIGWVLSGCAVLLLASVGMNIYLDKKN